MAIVSRQIALNVTQGTFNGGYTTTNHVRLTDNRMVILYNITGVSPDLYTRTFLVVDMADGLDTEIASPTITRTVGYLDKEAFQGNGVSVARLSDTRFVVSEVRTGGVKIEVFEISGTTITRVLNSTVLSSTAWRNNSVGASNVVIPLSATAFIQTYYNSSNQSTYAVYQFNPATTSPAVAASLTLIRQFTDSEADLLSDISWQQIPGTTDVMIVNRSVNANYYSYATRVWLVTSAGAQIRARFIVDGEPAFLGPNRMVVSKWGRQDYFKKDGTADGWSVTQNYTGKNDDNILFRPIIIPVSNDHHLQLRREFFQLLDTSIFMKAIRREDSNFHTVSVWSAVNWWGKVVPSSTTAQSATKFPLPYDKRAPIVTGRNRLLWAGLSASTYRLNMLLPTADAPVNPPATDPLPQPTRVMNSRFTFDNGLPTGVTLSNVLPRIIALADSTIGTSNVLASAAPNNSIDWTSTATFTVPLGMTKATVRYTYNTEQNYDTVYITLGGQMVMSGTGPNLSFAEATVTLSGTTTTYQMDLFQHTDGSVIAQPVSGVFVSSVEFRPV